MNTIQKITLIVCTIFVIISCSKDEVETESKENPVEGPVADTWTVNREDQYALNVIFFEPSDFDFNDDIRQQVSNLILYVQQWYEKQMKLNGFGEKTFGLVTNQEGLVRIHVIQSDKPSSYFREKEEAEMYSTLAEYNQAVTSFFNANPILKESEHNFIFSNEETLMRLVGSGRNAYTRSPDYSLEPTGLFIEDLELMASDKLGGMMHELGHGLNVPHNAHKKSDFPKVSLMSYGNHVYERNQQPASEDMVFLTKASAAILNVNQVFNKRTEGVNYYSNLNMNLEEFHVQLDKSTENIHVEGIVNSSVALTNFYIGHDGGDSGGANNNYDEVTFTGSFEAGDDGTYTFEMDMPYREIFNGYKDSEKNKIVLSLNSISENGIRKEIYSYKYTMNVSTNTPEDNINLSYSTFKLSDRSAWKISANTVSPNADRVVKKILDGDPESYWRSKYPYNLQTDGPHQVDIDMGDEKTFTGIYMNSNKNNSNYWRPKDVTILVNYNGSGYTEVKTFNLETDDIEQKLYLDDEITAQFIRILVKDVYHSKDDDESLLFNEIDIIN